MTILPLLLTSVLLCLQPTPERGCNRFDEKGRVVRSHSAKLDFLECVTGERKSKAGYYVEHLIPLACGGSDRARNMALVPIRLWDWKRRWERKDCEQTKEFLLALGVGEACYEKD